MFEFSKLRWGQTHLRQYILWGLTPVLALLLYQIISRGRRKRHNAQPPPKFARVARLDSEFYALERKLTSRGFIGKRVNH